MISYKRVLEKRFVANLNQVRLTLLIYFFVGKKGKNFLNVKKGKLLLTL